MNKELSADQLKNDLLDFSTKVQVLTVELAPYTGLQTVGVDINQAFNKLLEAKFWLVNTATMIQTEGQNGAVSKMPPQPSQD